MLRRRGLILLSLLGSSVAAAQVPGPGGPRSAADERKLFEEKLRRDIGKVARAIEVTETLIARSRGAPYLPDIYLRLAELYAEQSRYEFYLVHDSRGDGEGGAAVAPTSRLLKEKAVEMYRRILSEFAKWDDNDKVRFYLAHELRELGAYEEMLATYRQLAAEHPKSPLVLDAYLVLGDYHFDQSQLDEAEVWYRKVLSAPVSPTHDLAHFKLGWVAMNKTQFPVAFRHFEAAVKSPWGPPGGGGDRRLDVKREALLDLVFVFTEVKASKEALPYFRKLAPERNLYVLALDKLGRRYMVKQDYPAAARVFRELARLSHNPSENLERTSLVYEATVKSGRFDRVDQDIRDLLDALDAYRFDPRVPKDSRQTAERDVELQARDLATKAQERAKEAKSTALGVRVAGAYRRYLESFPNGPQRQQMVQNLADTLFEAKRFLDAGDRFEQTARLLSEGEEQRAALIDACAAFRQALEVGGPTMPRFDRLWAQRGLIQNGRTFTERYPDHPKVAEVQLNIGRSYFEGGEFDRAVGVFDEFLSRYPKDPRAETVADLILDAFAQERDYVGLADKARELAGLRIGGPAFASRMQSTAKAAEERQIGEVILTASVDAPGQDAGASLRKYWEENRDSPVAERTLYTAFVQSKEARDYEQVFSIGNKFIGAYPESTYLGDVFGTLAAFTTQVGAFEQAAVYLEEFESRFPDDASARRQRARAAGMRALLGDHARAAEGFSSLFERSKDPAQRAEYGSALLASLRVSSRWSEAQPVAQALDRAGLAKERANLVLGLAEMDAGRLDAAASHFAAAVRATTKAASPEARADAAEAAFRLGETHLERFRQASALPDLERAAAAKAEALASTEAAMVEVVGLGVGIWAVAALHRVAMAYAEMAGFLAEAPVPEGLSAEDLAQYTAAVEAQVGGLEGRAEELFSTCVERALAFGVLTAETRGCLAQGPTEAVAAVRPTAAAPTGESARKELEARIARRPRDLDTLRPMVEHLLAEGEASRAKLMALQGLEVDDRDARLHNLLGAAELALGDASAAYAAYGRAASFGHPFAVANQAALLASLGATEAATRLLERDPPERLPDSAVDLHPGAAAVVGAAR